MASVGKKLYETPRETLYYPSPYATTRISMYSADSESSSGQTNSLQRPIGNQRPEHTYDVPFPQKQVRFRQTVPKSKRYACTHLISLNCSYIIKFLNLKSS